MSNKAVKTDKKHEVDWEKVALGIITDAGLAKSLAMEAIGAAKKGDFDLAKTKLDQAHKSSADASRWHFDVIKAEANGQKLEYRVLFIHAEDQLLASQTVILLAQEMVDLYRLITPAK
ncbi:MULTISPECIES: PTS lactose/cellobiose transporter subunit IIA [unclassified Mycoplasma]|uniref:PTS lactose/cellobiose transporter subunit IIA n=1 Tax=unclassified Mycoplasma TaxID=2683645 RepID=UPI000FDE75A3